MTKGQHWHRILQGILDFYAYSLNLQLFAFILKGWVLQSLWFALRKRKVVLMASYMILKRQQGIMHFFHFFSKQWPVYVCIVMVLTGFSIDPALFYGWNRWICIRYIGLNVFHGEHISFSFFLLKRYSPKLTLFIISVQTCIHFGLLWKTRKGLERVFTLHHTVKLKEGTGAVMLLNR